MCDALCLYTMVSICSKINKSIDIFKERYSFSIGCLLYAADAFLGLC